MIHIRTATPQDAANIASLLNEIVARGGTTAIAAPVSAADIQNWMGHDKAMWHVAEDDGGAITGFQWIEPHPELPQDATDIASFVRIGRTGLGIATALFEATKKSARDMGYRKIDAIIRANNSGGLAYYQSRGFETIRHISGPQLPDGTHQDRVWTRYHLQ